MWQWVLMGSGYLPTNYCFRYATAVADAVKNHPSLLSVEKIVDRVFWSLDPAQRLNVLGLPDYTCHHWDFVDAAGYREQIPEGCFNCLRGSRTGEYRTLVSIDWDRPENELNFGIRLGTLFHELGHVDDFERGENLRVGEKIDAAKVESYAHRFASDRLAAEGLHLPLAYYLFHVGWQARSSPPVVQKAAQDFIKSGAYKTYVDFANDWLRPAIELRDQLPVVFARLRLSAA